MKLVKYKSNWADEMDINGVHIISDKAWDTIRELVEKVVDPEYETDDDYMYSGGEWSFGVGSNEQIDYRSMLDVFDDITVEDISEDEVNTFAKYIKLPFGFIPFDQMAESIKFNKQEEKELEWLFTEFYRFESN